MSKNIRILIVIFLTLAIVEGACNLPSSLTGQSTANPAVASAIPPASSVMPPATSGAGVPELPSVTPINGVGAPPATTALTTPNEPPGMVAAVKDNIYPTNSGDYFSINLFERPYQLDNSYRPDADIAIAGISADNTWYYFTTEIRDVNPATKQYDTPFGYEIDYNKDGRGDFLLWATPPYSTQWVNTDVQVYEDRNHDVGNRRPMLSDAPVTTPSDGYETTLFFNGSEPDPGAAWVRQVPNTVNTLQIAVKRSLINQNAFLWWAWTDFDLGKPTAFDYNDDFTIQQAGSPYPGDPNYPLKALYGMDNTCRVAYGFTPTGNEPGLCGGAQPTSAPGQPTSTATVLVRTAIMYPMVTYTPTNQMKPTPTTGITIVIKPTDTPTQAPVCTKATIEAQVTDASNAWDPSYASGVTLCIDGACQNPDSSGYVYWSEGPGAYTITATSNYGITPSSVTVKVGCGGKSLSQFVIGPG